MAKDKVTGDVICDRCKKYIGNYNNGNGNHFALIATKYCKDCKRIVKNEQTRMSKHNSNHGRKLLVDKLIEKTGLLEQENKALRELVLEVQNESGTTLKRLVREVVCEKLKPLVREVVCEVLKEILAEEK